MTKSVRIAVTGAAGQIGYSLLFRIASGELFGPDCGVELNLLELPQAVKAAEGTAMELDDCAFSALRRVECFDDPKRAFDGVNWALLVGSMPRGPGMERADLIKANGPIFVEQGKALQAAASDVMVVVVGNPCNTNALIAQHSCRDIPATRFTAMTALDENRAKAQLALKAGVSVGQVDRLALWGNHSPTMYPDFENARIGGNPVEQVVTDRPWLEGAFLETVQKRGAAIIDARGKSSAASAASACIDHVKKLTSKTPSGDWFSAGIPSDGAFYDVPPGILFSFPLTSQGNGDYRVVEGLELSEYGRNKLKVTADELLREREHVKDLLG